MAIIRIINVHGTFDAEPARSGESRLKWWQGERQFTGQPVEMPDRMEVPPSPFVEEIAKKFGGDEGRAVAECFRWSGSYKETQRREAGMALAEALESAIKADDDTYFILIGHSHGGNVIRYALQYIDLPKRQLERILSWNTVGTPFLHFRRPNSLWNLSRSKLLFVLGLSAFFFYGIATGVDVRCSVDKIAARDSFFPDFSCNWAQGWAPKKITQVIEGFDESFDELLELQDLSTDRPSMASQPAEMSAEADTGEEPPAEGDPLSDFATAPAEGEGEEPLEAEKYEEPSLGDHYSDLSGMMAEDAPMPQQFGLEEDFVQQQAVPAKGKSKDKEASPHDSAVNWLGEFQRGLFGMGGIVIALVAIFAFTGRKRDRALYNVFRTRRFRSVFLPKWNGFLSERDEAVVGLGLGAEKFSDKTKIIPQGALRPILFGVVLIVLFSLILRAEYDEESNNPFVAIIRSLKRLLTIKGKEEGMLSQTLSQQFTGLSDVTALFDAPFEFAVGSFVLVAVSLLFVSLSWADYLRTIGDARIVRSIRAVLLGTDDIQGESVFAVRYYPRKGEPSRAIVLSDEIAQAQQDRVNGSAPETLEFIRKEVGLYGLSLGGDIPNLSEKVGQHFTWDELYHTTYFTVPVVREFLIEKIAEKTPAARSFD
ncbi:esterase/lipase family protein [Parvularcula marina]|uniref:esterase/lipase family protein n=1 Tax=Parvularcula marina TaxID=2292771 RepID=UPI00351893BE